MSSRLDGWGQGIGHFCANPACMLHVTPSDPRVQGRGHWAIVDGVMYDRHPLEVDGPSFCSTCRKAMN